MAGTVPRPAACVVGVDVGLRRIKLVGIAGSGVLEVRWAVDVETPSGVFGADGQFDPVAAGRVVSQLLGDSRTGYSAALALPSTVLRVRRLAAASRDPATLRRALLADAELRVPGVAADQLHFAVSASSDTPGPDAGNAAPGVVAAAVRRDAIRAYSAVCVQAGLQPHRLTAPGIALSNLHGMLHPEEQDRPVLLLHIGSQRSDLVVVHRGGLLLSLSVVLATQQLLDRLPVPDSRHDEVQRRIDAAPDAQAAVQEWIGRLRGSHRTALGAAERHLGSSVDTLPVRVSGGAVRYPMLMDALAGGLEAQVDVLDPRPAQSSADGDWYGPAMVIALGSALEARGSEVGAGAPGPLPVLLNLAGAQEGAAPQRGPVALKAIVRDPAVWAAFVVALLLFVAVPALILGRIRQMELVFDRDRAAYQREAQQVAADSARVSLLKADSARLAGTLGILAELEADRYGWPKLMAAAAGSLPPYSWLEAIELVPAAVGAPSTFRLRGVAPSQAEVSGFERNLRGAVAEVALEGSESLMVGPFPLVGFRFAGTVSDTASSSDQPHRLGAGYNGGSTPAVPTESAP